MPTQVQYQEHICSPFRQACMLVFYPDFDSSSSSDEIVLLLDTSESMRGEAQQNARRIALEILRRLDPTLKVNIIIFGEGKKSRQQ